MKSLDLLGRLTLFKGPLPESLNRTICFCTQRAPSKIVRSLSEIATRIAQFLFLFFCIHGGTPRKIENLLICCWVDWIHVFLEVLPELHNFFICFIYFAHKGYLVKSSDLSLGQLIFFLGSSARIVESYDLFLHTRDP